MAARGAGRGRKAVLGELPPPVQRPGSAISAPKRSVAGGRARLVALLVSTPVIREVEPARLLPVFRAGTLLGLDPVPA